MMDLTLVLPHYRNLGMLAEQQAVWASYPADLRARLHVVVVDDCSPVDEAPTAAAVTVSGLASFRIYRLTEKKRWNWLACRNLGAKVATTDWLLLTDIDHVVPAETMWLVLDGVLDPRDAHRFKRVTVQKPWPWVLSEQPSYKPHNDSWLLTRDLFFYDDGRKKFVAGYDERLSGCYGTSGEFKDRVLSVARAQVILDAALVRYPREVIADASTSPDVYTRKGDPVNDADITRRKDERAQIDGWRPLHGLIASELVYASTGAVPC